MTIVNDISNGSAPLESLPADLEDLEPGARLAEVVWSVDRTRLGDADVVRLLVARDRLVSHLQAGRAADIAEIVNRVDPDVREFAALEVAAALHLTRAAADGEAAFARDVTDRLPLVGELLASGRIDLRRARVLVDATFGLEPEVARQILVEVGAEAPELTTGQLRAMLRRRRALADPEHAVKLLERGVEDRRVVVQEVLDGTAELYLLGVAPDRAMAAWERIDRLARLLPGDERSIDQRRADVAVDLLCGRGLPAGRGMVDLTVDLPTLLGLAENPGELGGWGPVVADIARQVADRQVDGRWQATVIDANGDPLAVALRRRPTAAQARQVRARYRTCVFPGCRRPARAADLDHTTRHIDGGRTLETNLAPLCRHHHRAKDEGGWQYRRSPDGDHVWTSPTGRHYVTSGRSP